MREAWTSACFMCSQARDGAVRTVGRGEHRYETGTLRRVSVYTSREGGKLDTVLPRDGCEGSGPEDRETCQCFAANFHVVDVCAVDSEAARATLQLRYAVFFCEILCIFAVLLSGPPPQWKQIGSGANEKRLRTPEPCGVAGYHVENDEHL